ncbi:MAG: hypothetical protein IT158_13110 [Bryobacterales bacterium]|nr:hypothetical protein [Bryobacterales bacterium]
MTEPFPLELLRQYHRGVSVAQLAALTGIPEERIAMRLRAAALCLLSLGADHNFTVKIESLEPFTVDWDLLWFD